MGGLIDPAAGEGVERFERYVHAFARNSRDPSMRTYPGLRSVPWRDPGDVAIVAELEHRFEEIRQEIQDLDDDTFHSESEVIRRRGSWDVALLYAGGRKDRTLCARCPVTTALVERHATVRTFAGLVYASRLRVGAHIAAHHGPTNLRTRCHLGIDVPDGDCGLRVGDETRRWVNGRCLVFDDCFEHAVWNHTDHDRVVLVVDLWHPDLTPYEINLLSGLHRYVNANVRSVEAYEEANAAARAPDQRRG